MTQAIIHTLSISHQAGLVQIPSSLKALNDDEVRIDTLFSGINKNDLLYLDGKHKKDYFGVQAIGKVVAIGKNVGHCKVNDIVGVYHGNTNSGDFKTGFSTSLQANQKDIIYIPNTIAPEQAASLLGSGTTAFNALQKFDKGSHIAVVGTGLLAYLTSQYATKFFGFKVTLFGYEGSAYLAQFFGAEEFIILSNETINKNIQKYHNIVITEPIKEADAVYVQNIAYRTGKVVMAIDMGYYPEIKVFDLVCSQREFVGVKRGSYKQAVRALQAAVFHGVRANVQVFTRQDFAKAFERARQGDAVSVVLKY